MKTSSGHISIADWAVAPQELTLAKGEVHVWRAFIDQFAAFTDEFAMALNDEEQDAARRFRFERDRNSYTITRALLRKILSRYLACDPGRLIFDYSERGKPSVSGMPLHFNVSHSRGVALFAITRDCEVGVDLEQVRAMDDLLDIARNFFFHP